MDKNISHIAVIRERFDHHRGMWWPSSNVGSTHSKLCVRISAGYGQMQTKRQYQHFADLCDKFPAHLLACIRLDLLEAVERRRLDEIDWRCRECGQITQHGEHHAR